MRLGRVAGVSFMTRNIKLVLEYDGAPFFGFQKQPGKPTVQQALEHALSRFFNQPMKISAASGRTDTGVHAENQVVNFRTASDRDPGLIRKGLNAHLPPHIVVKSVEEVSPDFHSRYDAKSKIYEYRVWNAPFRSPLLNARVFHVPFRLNLPEIRKAARRLVGRHDFSSFTSGSALSGGLGKKKGGRVRTVKKISIQKKGDLLIFQVEADGFLYHMVRNIVGTLLEVGRGKRRPEEMAKILRAKSRRFSGSTAPAKGLTLRQVIY